MGLEKYQDKILLITSILLIIGGITYTLIQPSTISVYIENSQQKVRNFTDLTVIACCIMFGMVYWLYIFTGLIGSVMNQEYLMSLIVLGILILLLMIIVSMFNLFNYKIKKNLQLKKESADPFQLAWRDIIIIVIGLILYGLSIKFYSSKE